MGVEMLRERLRDAGNADVPGDVAHQLALGQAEIAENARDQPAVMVAGQQEGRASAGIEFADRRNLFGL